MSYGSFSLEATCDEKEAYGLKAERSFLSMFFLIKIPCRVEFMKLGKVH